MFSFPLPFPFTGDMSPDDFLQFEPVRRERLSPAEFLEALNSDRDNIESSHFVAPQLGDDHFGYFEVEYRNPVYR